MLKTWRDMDLDRRVAATSLVLWMASIYPVYAFILWVPTAADWWFLDYLTYVLAFCWFYLLILFYKYIGWFFEKRDSSS